MKVVADTSPLNYLILLGRADLLQVLYGQVIVPSAVLLEMQHPAAPHEVRAWAVDPPPWVVVNPVKFLDATLPAELGMGEREAISLTLELRAGLLLIDERAGRQEASARHIAIAGTLAVLLQASLRGYLSLPSAIVQLQRQGFRASPRVVAGMLARYEAGKRESHGHAQT